MYRARLHWDVEFLVYLQGVVAASQEFVERRLVASAYVLVDWLEDLDRARERARLDDADECPPDAYARLEERSVRCDAFGAL